MYSKQEASFINQQFWTAFGQYMAPILNADGKKINWINYKTGQKHIRFLMQANSKEAVVLIEFSQQEHYKIFLQLRTLFNSIAGESWSWMQNVIDEDGKTISHVATQLTGVNVFNKNHWPAIISFLKTNMIAVDSFWCQHNVAFER